jgi:hypothetical protein
MKKFQAPSTNIQRSIKLQAPTLRRVAGGCLKIGAWNFSGAWMLVLGAFTRSSLFIFA